MPGQRNAARVSPARMIRACSASTDVRPAASRALNSFRARQRDPEIRARPAARTDDHRERPDQAELLADRGDHEVGVRPRGCSAASPGRVRRRRRRPSRTRTAPGRAGSRPCRGTPTDRARSGPACARARTAWLASAPPTTSRPGRPRRSWRDRWRRTASPAATVENSSAGPRSFCSQNSSSATPTMTRIGAR